LSSTSFRLLEAALRLYEVRLLGLFEIGAFAVTQVLLIISLVYVADSSFAIDIGAGQAKDSILVSFKQKKDLQHKPEQIVD
jgi:hypothetical protein